MNVRIKALWNKMLRSGIPQTTGALYRPTDGLSYDDGDDDLLAGACCLGLLCELHRQDTGNGQWVESDGAVMYKCFDDKGTDMDSEVLPYPVQRWAGLTETNPSVQTDDGDTCQLGALNDAGVSFERIAGLILKSL